MSPKLARRFLGIGGGALIVLGGIGALLLKGQAESDARVAQYSASFSGRLIDFDPDYTGAVIALGFAVVGVAMLVTLLALAASGRPSAP